jgi:hypothetical protein
MEKEIKIVINVNNEQHAQLVLADIINAVELRTTIFFVSDMKTPKYSSDTLHKERMK